MMYSLILIAVAAACNAVMDTLSHHYSTSIFNGKDDTFWNPSVSWKRKYSLPDWYPDALSDGWHIFKTTMIFSLVGAIISYIPQSEWYVYVIHYAALGTTWNVVFSLFYNKLLIRKVVT